jgi:hypothetical protein
MSGGANFMVSPLAGLAAEEQCLWRGCGPDRETTVRPQVAGAPRWGSCTVALQRWRWAEQNTKDLFATCSRTLYNRLGSPQSRLHRYEGDWLTRWQAWFNLAPRP